MEAIFSLIGGTVIDAILKLFTLRIDWGFSNEKNPVLCLFAGIILLMLPIGIANNCGKVYYIGLFVGLLFITLLFYISYYEKPKDDKPSDSREDILDD